MGSATPRLSPACRPRLLFPQHRRRFRVPITCASWQRHRVPILSDIVHFASTSPFYTPSSSPWLDARASDDSQIITCRALPLHLPLTISLPSTGTNRACFVENEASCPSPSAHRLHQSYPMLLRLLGSEGNIEFCQATTLLVTPSSRKNLSTSISFFPLFDLRGGS